MAKKRKASDSLAKLRTGLARDTPATRAPDGVAREKPKSNPRQGWAAPAGEKMVRVSVDLPRSRHKFLRDFAYDAETDGMSVMRGLLEILQEDSDLADRLRDRLMP